MIEKFDIDEYYDRLFELHQAIVNILPFVPGDAPVHARLIDLKFEVFGELERTSTAIDAETPGNL